MTPPCDHVVANATREALGSTSPLLLAIRTVITRRSRCCAYVCEGQE